MAQLSCIVGCYGCATTYGRYVYDMAACCRQCQLTQADIIDVASSSTYWPRDRLAGRGERFKFCSVMGHETLRNSTVELCDIGRCELAVTRSIIDVGPEQCSAEFIIAPAHSKLPSSH